MFHSVNSPACVDVTHLQLLEVALRLSTKQIHFVTAQTRAAAESQLVVSGCSRRPIVVVAVRRRRRPRLVDVQVSVAARRTAATPGAPVGGGRRRLVVVGRLRASRGSTVGSCAVLDSVVAVGGRGRRRTDVEVHRLHHRREKNTSAQIVKCMISVVATHWADKPTGNGRLSDKNNDFQQHIPFAKFKPVSI